VNEELKRISQNGFQECFQHLYSHWHKVLFWRKCSLNDWTVSYFSEIMWFREHFEATM
jgi:hypothetical protein